MGTDSRSTSSSMGSRIGRTVKVAVAGVALAASGVAMTAGTAGAASGSGDGNLKALGRGTVVVNGDFTSGKMGGQGVLLVVDPDHDLEVTVAHYAEKREGGAVTIYLGWSGEVTIGDGDGAIAAASTAGMGLSVTGHGRYHLEGRGVWDTEPGGQGFWGSRRHPTNGAI